MSEHWRIGKDTWLYEVNGIYAADIILGVPWMRGTRALVDIRARSEVFKGQGVCRGVLWFTLVEQIYGEGYGGVCLGNMVGYFIGHESIHIIKGIITIIIDRSRRKMRGINTDIQSCIQVIHSHDLDIIICDPSIFI